MGKCLVYSVLFCDAESEAIRLYNIRFFLKKITLYFSGMEPTRRQDFF